ncbi:MAG: hypothetical protein PUD20_08690 [bacterium]|nr:hypothetical protein [bacterium]
MRSKHEISFPKLEKELYNSHTGEKRTFLLRPFEPGDESGMIACIKDEYADSYFKRDFYDEKKLRQKAAGDHYVFFVAETEREIAGMEIFALFTEDGDDYIEPASQIFRMRYRGFGLAEELVNYTFVLAKQMQPQALFVHAVTFHSITQKVCGAQGMIPTGFRLGSFLAEKMKNSYPKGSCPKHSEGIMILPVQKKDAGTVYVPEEVSGYVTDCYNRLEMTCLVCTKREELSQTPARLDVVTDEVQRTILIRVLQIGADLTKQVRAILSSCHEQPFWTCQITLPVDDGDAITAYEQLKEEGFFFTGLKAACAQTEQIFMQWCGDLELHMEEYTLTEEFGVIREQIQHFYEGRILS